jgi:hypothetical protein
MGPSARREKRFWLAISLVLLACSGKSRDNSAAKLPPCKSFGQSCMYLPGKLGSCVQRDGCQGPDCFVCQSQH